MTSLPLRQPGRTLPGALLLLALGCSRLASAAEDAAVHLAFFENRIRPLLADNCFSCHGPEKQKGNLRLDSREGVLAGGDHGPALVAGVPGQSRLLEAVSYTNSNFQMPPKKRLSARQVTDLEQWIAAGAAWPNSGDPAKTTRVVKSGAEISSQDRAWWAFQPVRRPAVPRPKSRTANPIDAFLWARLEAKGLEPNPGATPRELIRRVYFDLIGLPPTPEAVAAFEREPTPRAWEQVIDDLLARAEYGERWGRHWLDVVRYAQSNGYERDSEKPYAWRYRDYVVRAFNEDKPYDQFVREQLAGDELDDLTPDSLIATGFFHLGVRDDEPDDKRMAEFDELDDILSTTGTTFLGLTLGCARCHEHKFDPIPQADYYQLLAFFRNVRLYEPPRYTFDSPNYVPLESATVVEAWKTEHQTRLTRLQDELKGVTNGELKKKLSGQVDRVKGENPPFTWALAVRERGAKPPPTQVLIRGNAGSPGAEVEPAFLSVLGGQRPTLKAPGPEARTSGRRRLLAEWLTSPQQPLTARVLVNRVWHYHFGRGIAKTTSDFGRAGIAPTHPELLDWLAAEFVSNGWSLKKLHKIILQSNAYQMSSRTDQPKAADTDPGNELFWRQNLRRLEAESLRDSILAISGQLNGRMAGRGFFPTLSGEALAGQSRPGLDWERSSAAEESRRSLYAFVRRTMLVPVFEAFDYNNTSTPLSERPVTTVAPQALLLLNDQFMHTQATAFAQRLRREAGDSEHQCIARGFELALGRSPSRQERTVARRFLDDQERAFLALRLRRTFTVEVPASLSVDYMGRLQPADFLSGPAQGWTYHRGLWSGAYEGIRTVDRARGPFALVAQEPFADGLVRSTLLLHNASESAGLLVRAEADGTELRGYEVHLDPRGQRLSLRRHSKQLETLTETACTLSPGRPVDVRVQVNGGQFRVWLDQASAPLLDFTDRAPVLSAGRVGVRTWGASLSLDELIIEAGGRALHPLETATPVPARERALEAFCLLLLNLNEVVYVD